MDYCPGYVTDGLEVMDRYSISKIRDALSKCEGTL